MSQQPEEASPPRVMRPSQAEGPHEIQSEVEERIRRDEEELEVEDHWVPEIGVRVAGSEREVIDLAFYAACLTECVAATLFQIFVTLALMSIGSGPISDEGVVKLALVAGTSFFVLLYCITPISGGHINPAISFGLLLSKRITINRAIFYIVSQLLGAMVGSAIARAYSPWAFDQVHGGASTISRLSTGAGVGSEVVASVYLVMSVLFAKDTLRATAHPYMKVIGPMEIASTLLVAYLGLAPYTPACINPAQSLGSAVVSGYWWRHWVFWVGPLVGAGIAGIFFRLFFSTVMYEMTPVLGT